MRVINNRVCAARLDRVYISLNLSSKLSRSSITPVGFTDHHCVCMDLIISPGKRIKSYWHFNNNLYETASFLTRFSIFGSAGKIEKQILLL